MSETTLIKLIDTRLNGQGTVIVEEAKRAGLELALAAALVEQESGGFNIFGADHGDVGDHPPYYRQTVTKARVAALRGNGKYPYGMNGIGLTQLTWWEFVEQAEALGGAHLPRNQCRVGFGLLRSYIEQYPYAEALGAYNAGEGNRHSVLHTYAAALAAKHAEWKTRIGEEEKPVPGYPTIWVARDAAGWLKDEATGMFIRAKDRPNAAFAANSAGWMYPESRGKRVPGPEPNPHGTWIERHPTRFGWRRDVADLTRSIEAEYDVFINTYVDHPEGWSRKLGVNLDELSFDVWAPAGRGAAINPAVGQAIVDRVLGDPNPPYVWWCIWAGMIYGWNGPYWEVFQDDGTGSHHDHPHLTLKA